MSTLLPTNDAVKAFGTTYGYGCQYNDILYKYLRDKFATTPRATLPDLMARWDGILTPLTTPDTMEGLVLWLDSSDESSISDTGGLVDQWNDKSGLGNHAVGTGANRPTTGASTINSLNTIQFSSASSTFLNCGQDSSLDLTPTTDHITMIGVHKVTAGAIFGKAGATISQRQYYMFFQSNITFVMGGAFANTSTNPSGVAAVTGNLVNTTRQEVYHNSTLEDVRSILGGTNVADVLIGARRGTDINTGTGFHMTGEVGELILYNRELTARAMVNLQDALKTKWGIT